MRLGTSEEHRRGVVAGIAHLRKAKTDSSLFETLQQEICDTTVSSEELSRLHLALGRIYENSGEYAKAFDHFRQSKSFLTRAFDLEKFRAVVDNIIKDYKPEVFRQFEGYGDSSPLPVFIVGMPRSGTTLLPTARPEVLAS